MTEIDTINLIANYVVLAYVLPLGAFIALYATRSPWRNTELGVALMIQKIAFTVLILVLLGSYFIGSDYPGREWVRLFGFLAVGYTLVLDVVNLLRYQRKARE